MLDDKYISHTPAVPEIEAEWRWIAAAAKGRAMKSSQVALML